MYRVLVKPSGSNSDGRVDVTPYTLQNMDNRSTDWGPLSNDPRRSTLIRGCTEHIHFFTS
jgi:hypothetical protein